MGTCESLSLQLAKQKSSYSEEMFGHLWYSNCCYFHVLNTYSGSLDLKRKGVYLWSVGLIIHEVNSRLSEIQNGFAGLKARFSYACLFKQCKMFSKFAEPN